MRDDSLGIYCVTAKEFFYLESGNVYVNNTVDRLKKVLIKRDKIEFTPQTFLDTQNYRVMSCRDAKIEDYKMTPIYISQHVKTTVANEKEPGTTPKKRSWG